MDDSLPVFINPRAGSATNKLEELQEAFGTAGARVSIIEARGQQLEDSIRGVVAAGASVVGIAGGDGTISTAANVLANSNAALLPIPLGTRNHFSQRYGIPSIEAAVHAWQHGSAHAVHVGSVNNRVFINNASCGFYPRLVRKREQLETVLPRVAAMWAAGLGVLLKLPTLELEIDAAGRQQRVHTPALWVGIGVNSLRLPIPGDAHVQDAVLEAVSGRAESRAAVVKMAFRLFRHLKRGLEPNDEKLDVLRARTFTVKARKAIDVALDGEPVSMRGPLTFSIRDHALRVICLVAPTG